MKNHVYDEFLDMSKWRVLDGGSRIERDEFNGYVATISRFGDGWNFRAERVCAGDGVSAIAHYAPLGYSEALESCCSEICKAVHDNNELWKARAIR